MGCKNWFSSLIGRNKSKKNWCMEKDKIHNSAISDTGTLDANTAATRIQKAFRAHRARKRIARLRETGRIKNTLIQGRTVEQQTSSTLSHLHFWCKIQGQVRSRRLYMVTNGRLKQRRLENQLKLDTKLHDLEVEWCGGSETMEEILFRMTQREDAAVKRERALAYAFNHQWRANPSQYLGQASYSLEKEEWGWSWVERWVAARPWEVRPHHARKEAGSNKSDQKEFKTGSNNCVLSGTTSTISKAKKIAPVEVQ